MAVANYRSANGERYPPAFVLGRDGRPWHSWRVLILPFIEQDSIFKRYKMDEPWDGPNNRQLADPMPRTFGFPVRGKKGSVVANYLAVVGAETMWQGAKSRTSEPKDGAANTILIAENFGLDVHWMEPRDLNFADMSFELQKPDGISSRYKVPAVAMADTTIRTLQPGLDPNVLRAMLTADGGEKIADTPDGWKIVEDGRDRELR